jgi:hypothetical protein
MRKQTRLGLSAGGALFIAWGCSVDETAIGSNHWEGQGGQSAGEGGQSETSGTGGTTLGSGASSQGGSSGAGRGGSDSGGTRNGEAGDAGAPAAGKAGSGNASGDGGSSGAQSCECPYPAVLGGDCCAVRDACDTGAVDCETLRQAIIDLRVWEEPEDWGAEEREDLEQCVSDISRALVERCAFVPPNDCGEPAEDFATFGDPIEEGYSECSDAETRAALGCGEPGSYYGPNCCQRKRCLSDDECENARCIYRRAQSVHSVDPYPHVQECALFGSGCFCSGPAVGEPHIGYCIGEDEDIARFDCEVETKPCEELVAWDEDLLLALEHSNAFDSGPYALRQAAVDAYWSCEEKISNELQERCGAPPDCRTGECPFPAWECIACPDPEGGTHYRCASSPDGCPILEGAAGAGSAE